MNYMTLKEVSQKWNVTPRQVNYLCAGGRIPFGALFPIFCLEFLTE